MSEVKQPEALRLAEKLDYHVSHRSEREAATELRRLHEQNAELLEALRAMLAVKTELDAEIAERDARAAIAKATGETE